MLLVFKSIGVHRDRFGRFIGNGPSTAGLAHFHKSKAFAGYLKDEIPRDDLLKQYKLETPKRLHTGGATNIEVRSYGDHGNTTVGTRWADGEGTSTISAHTRSSGFDFGVGDVLEGSHSHVKASLKDSASLLDLEKHEEYVTKALRGLVSELVSSRDKSKPLSEITEKAKVLRGLLLRDRGLAAHVLGYDGVVNLGTGGVSITNPEVLHDVRVKKSDTAAADINST